MEDNTQVQDQQQDQSKESAKVTASFDSVVKKLTAIVKGPDNLKVSKKIPKGSVESLVNELFEDETKLLISTVKEDLKGLLKSYVTLNNLLMEERKKLDALEITKKKEFNVAATKLFNKIDGVDSISREYYDAFNAAASSKEE